VITGGSSGIGWCTAQAFARRRANLVLVGRDATALAEAAERCRAAGAHTLEMPGDVTRRPQRVVRDPAALPGPRRRRPDQRRVDRRPAAQPVGASYSAAKFGVAGFTESLRAELGARSGVAVCGVYPAFVDTPTALRSGNYTSRTLRPVPPVVSPERVAAAVVSLAGRPRSARRVGSQHLLSVPYAVAPGLTGRLAARLAGWYFGRAGEPAEPTDGALFAVRPGPVSGRGGWGYEQRMKARTVVASVAVAGLAGAAATRARRRAATADQRRR
jgi:NAD(P)-dependent dehydrogenase (short-subunit alcohol dehydrogenase family)